MLRFARMKGAAAAEIECALEAAPCAVFDSMVGRRFSEHNFWGLVLEQSEKSSAIILYGVNT